MPENGKENKQDQEMCSGSTGPEVSVPSDRKNNNPYLEPAISACRCNRLKEYSINEKKRLKERLKYCSEAGDSEMADSVRNQISMLDEACRYAVSFATGENVCPVCGRKLKGPQCVCQGDIISFGVYPYESNGTKKPLEWLVLETEKDGTLFLLSRRGIDAKPYNRQYSETSWENCTLRQWLNTEFYNNAFNDREKAAVKTVQTETRKKFPFMRPDPVYDKVFILNAAEAGRYFLSDEQRKCVLSPYARMCGAYCGDSSCWWWLRSMGEDACHAAYVNLGGDINIIGSNISDEQGTVRAAIKINSHLFWH